VKKTRFIAVKKTRFIAAYPMRNKSETIEKFHEFYKMINAKTDIVIKRLRSDNGGEYKNKKMKKELKR
jgi:pyruvate/2-oxoacid:ferredoxin oxidoreductase alpha subunit